MNTRTKIVAGLALLLAALLAWPSLKRAFWDSPSAPPENQETKRKCVVCGMFLDSYPNWIATIRFRDGHEVGFDGLKDLFKYYLDMPRYDASRTFARIDAIRFTEYYSLRAIDGYSAHLVIGSDVLGPMGHELVPFASAQAAAEFLRDHHGDRVLNFTDVTPEVISQLDQMPRTAAR